jgi:hypothetical protein
MARENEPVSHEIYDLRIDVSTPTNPDGTPADPAGLEKIKTPSPEHTWSCNLINAKGGSSFMGGESVPQCDNALQALRHVLAYRQSYIKFLNQHEIPITQADLCSYHRVKVNWGKSYEEYLQRFKK